MSKNTKKILIIDADRLLVKAYYDHLVNEGYDVETTSNTTEALSITNSFKPDLIIIDIALPFDDGIAFIKKVKKNKISSSIPIIVLTNVEDKNSLIKASQAGATLYMNKFDYTLADVSKQIVSLLE